MQLFRDDVVGGPAYSIFVQPQRLQHQLLQQQNQQFRLVDQRLNVLRQQVLNQNQGLVLGNTRQAGAGQLQQRPTLGAANVNPPATFFNYSHYYNQAQRSR